MERGGVIVNPYLEGDFGPVSEERTELDLPVTGSVPEWLDGRYLRNGPNPIGPTDPTAYSWFMGTGMVHGLALRGGRAEWYRNRYVRSAAVSATLGEHRRPGRVHSGFDFPANTSVVGFAGATLAVVEGGPLPYELDDELGTVGSYDFGGTLPGGYTAHPLVDPGTGEMHALSYFFGWANSVRYTVAGADGRVRRAVDIEVGGSPMMHAFSLTERYVIVYDLPVTFDPAKAAQAAPGPLAKPVALAMSKVVGRRRLPEALTAAMLSRASGQGGFPYSWNPGYPARVGLMPREGGSGDVRWLDVEPCYVYHPVNAHDDEDRVVIDVVRHPSTFATDARGPVEGSPTLDRWTVDVTAGKVIEERLDDRGQEFPRVDDRLVGRPARYAYTVASGPLHPGQAPAAHTLVRHDLAGAGALTRNFGPGSELDELVFVPAGADAAEDDGVVMGFVYDRETDRSDLAILDAATLEDVARVHLPVRVPHGFHGNWLPSA